MMYKAVFFPDPYNVRIRHTISWDADHEFYEMVVTYLRKHPETGYIMYKDDQELDRIYYYYINHKLGRV